MVTGPTTESLDVPSPVRKLSYQRASHMLDYLATDPAAWLRNPHFNKFTAFTLKEREKFGLRGLLPGVVEDIDQQCKRCYIQLSRFQLPMSKHIFLSTLRTRNETLFYYLIITHLEELLPYIYTPTVGQACLEFGLQCRHAEGMYISTTDRGLIRSMLDNWKPNFKSEVAIVVLTDGSRILGLGDLGVSGMAIPVGKLSLYVAAGGFHPTAVLPIVIDSGTDNETLRHDEFYLGERHPRLPDEEYYAMVDELLIAIKDAWPQAVLQFEDFSNNHCFELLSKYRRRMLCFNDDIQGTGSVIAAGFLNALKIAGYATEDVLKLRVVMAGAGAAGTGVVEQICRVLQKRYGMTMATARNLFFMVDSKGLVTTSRGDQLADFKVLYARKDVDAELGTLLDVIVHVKPHALVGLSCTPGLFDEKVLTRMGALNERPIVFSLSNPTSKSECSFEDAIKHTEGRVIFASGSPFDAVQYEGKVMHAPQGNNLYSFPGIGFGAWLSRATIITDGMIDAATLALADQVGEERLAQNQLYPVLQNVRNVSARISTAVAIQANAEGVATAPLPYSDRDSVQRVVEDSMYFPKYLNAE